MTLPGLIKEFPMDINQNFAECIREVRNVGNTVTMNICSGEQVVIPWGSADWILAGLVTTMVVALVSVVVFGIFAFATDYI